MISHTSNQARERVTNEHWMSQVYSMNGGLVNDETETETEHFWAETRTLHMQGWLYFQFQFAKRMNEGALNWF